MASSFSAAPLGLFGPGLPLLNRAFAGVEVAGKHGLTDLVALAELLDRRRRDVGVTARQVSSKSRIVALSIAPTLNIAEADEWIASKASLLNLRLAVMANLRKMSIFQQLI